MAKLNDLIVTGDTKMLGKLHANADTATTASSIFDSGNKNLITLNYSASAISDPTWLAAWNGYELRGVARASLSVGTADKASYLTSQGAIVANTRTQSASQAVLAGGWSTNEAGFGSQYGTTLDISGFSTWYHRLAFHTGGEIDYWIGINTNTLTKKGRLLTSANYTSYALPRDGSVGMTGVLHLKAEQYTDSITAGALNANNSNIYGVNSIYTAGLADGASEGIHFYRTSTTVDSLWGKNGVLYFSPNRTVGSGSSTDYTILHTGNYKTYALARDGSNTMTGALQFANSTGIWAATANYANSLILFGERTHDEVTSRHYFPWMGGCDGVNSKGYLGTITMGLFHGAPTDAGLFIGASWDKANADTFFYFTRRGTFETPRVAVGGYNNTTYALSTSSFICNSWIHTTGSTGWYNESYGGGVHMIDGTYVRIYNDKAFYVSNSGQRAIYTAGGFASSNSNGAILSTYYNSTWYSSIKTHGDGNLSISPPGGSLYIAYDCGNTYFGGGTYYIDRAGYFNGKAEKANKDGDGNTISSTYLKLSGGTMTGNITLGTSGILGFGNTIPATHKEVTSFTPEADAVWLATTGGVGESAGICLDGASIRFWTPNDSIIEFLDSDTPAGTLYASVKMGSLTLTSALSVANGGTGITSWTTNRLIYASGATTLTTSSIYVGYDRLYYTTNGFGYLGTSSYAWAGVYATTFYASSDIRRKKDIVAYSLTEDILSLPLYRFKYIDNDEKEHIGCMAQDLQKICPDLVEADEEDYLSVKENKLVYILLDRMKKMQKEIDELKEASYNG